MQWIDQKETNEFLLNCQELLHIHEAQQWKQAGLDRTPALFVVENENRAVFVNYFAIQAIETQVPETWKLPSAEEWFACATEGDLDKFTKQLFGEITPYGERSNQGFGASFWTADTRGERHAFKIFLTNLYSRMYKQTGVMTEGYLVKFLKHEAIER